MDDQNDPTEDDTPRIRPFAASLQEMDRGGRLYRRTWAGLISLGPEVNTSAA